MQKNIKNIKSIVTLLGLVALCQGAGAAGETGSGESLYATCAACHGSDGAGNPAMDAPALAGQHADYVARQIRHFQQGVRGADPRDVPARQMRGMAAMLAAPGAVDAVSDYIAGLPAVAGGEAPEHDRRNGEVQYNAACGACHGPRAQGNPSLNAPNLAILDEAYLRRQYANFQQGIRGDHPEDKYGKQMQMMSSMLATDKDLDDVIGFILSQ